MQINSVFTVTNYGTNKSETIAVAGSGQELIPFLKQEYPNRGRDDFHKFVLEGFQVNGNFIPLNTNTSNKL